MFKRIFDSCEGIFQALVYLMTLIMALALAALGAFVVIMVAIRGGQFLWSVLFQHKWW